MMKFKNPDRYKFVSKRVITKLGVCSKCSHPQLIINHNLHLQTHAMGWVPPKRYAFCRIKVKLSSTQIKTLYNFQLSSPHTLPKVSQFLSSLHDDQTRMFIVWGAIDIMQVTTIENNLVNCFPYQFFINNPVLAWFFIR